MGNKGEKLPNNTVFSKKNLGFFLFLCVFGTALNCSAQGYTSADIACTDICEEEGCNIPEDLTGSNIEEKCKNVKGCKYNNTGCRFGDPNYYTNVNTINECPGDYPLSATGSWDANQCYKSVNLDQATIKCRIYQSGTVMCATSNITQCQGTWGNSPIQNGDGFCELNSAAVSNNQYATQNSTNLSAAHLENNSVYLNTRACNLFTNNTTPVPNVSSEEAEWFSGNGDNNPGHWDVSGCRKTESFNDSNQITLFSDEHPNCTGVKVSKPTGNNMSVNSATNQIIYTEVGYFCTKCDPGYSITNPLSSNSNLQLFNNQGSNYVSSNYCTTNNINSAWPAANNQPFYVCKCIEVANGYYVDQQQTICNFTNNDADCHLNVDELTSFDNVVKKCPAGKTGPNGAIDQAQCYYGNYYSPASQNNSTQFCDAFGCVWLDGLSFDSINQTYSWDGDVHLVGVRTDENADYYCPDYHNVTIFWGYDKDGNPINAQGNTVNNCQN